MERSLRMRYVTWPITGGQKWSTFLESLTLIFLLTFSLSGRYMKIKPCNRRKIAFFSLWRQQSSLRMRSTRDLCIRGPPKPHITIFDTELSIHYTTFMGLRWRLRVVLYWSIPMLKQFVAAKNSSSQNRSPKWRFSEILGSKYKIQPLGPPKATSLPGTTSFDVVCVKLRSGV